MQAVLIGLIAGTDCFWACTWLKIKCGYDDSLDVFGVHGIGGFTGTLLAGVFAVAGPVSRPRTRRRASPDCSKATRNSWWRSSMASSSPSCGPASSPCHSQVTEFMVPLRVRQEDEVMGLDVSQHGEALQ